MLRRVERERLNTEFIIFFHNNYVVHSGTVWRVNYSSFLNIHVYSWSCDFCVLSLYMYV